MNDEGAASLVVVVLLVVGVILGMLVSDVAKVAAARGRLAGAADAAALAAAPATFADFGAGGNPRRAAAATARANGADLIECRCEIDRSWMARTVYVKVTRDVSLVLLGSLSLTAEAAAEFVPVRLGGG